MALALLVFETDAVTADQLGDAMLELGALSVTSEDAQAGTLQEQPIFDEPGETGAWALLRMRVLIGEDQDAGMFLQDACAAADVPVPRRFSAEPVAERDWVRETQAQFDPIRISERLWIVPSWHAAPDPTAISISLDPGIAFGTGSHPTTRLCLQWLENHVVGGETVLDYGCGSGILAIAAMKLGAAHALGVDIDPAAVGAARENAALNCVTCEFSDSRTPLTIEADIVVANILANPLKVLAPLLARLVVPGGRIALSGILETQLEETERCYQRWFAFEPAACSDGWVCLSGVRLAIEP